MATVTILRRATGKAHTTSVLEADQAILGGLVRSTAGAGALYDDANTTSVTLGAGAAVASVTVGGAATTTGTILTGSAMTALNIGTGMGAGDNITVGGGGSTTTIAGDLVVNGTTSSIDSEVVNIADNHLYLNKDYTATSAQTGGLVVNYLPTATASTTDTGGFATTSTVNVGDGTAIAAGDFIQVSGANIAANDGLYEVLSVNTAGDPDIVTIDATPTHDFAQTAFTVDATDTTATITKVNVSVMRAGTDGVWETGAGSTVGGLTFSDLASGGGNSLQGAYVQGNTITMTDAEGDFAVSVTSGTPAITLDAAGASNFTVAGAALTLSTTTSGALDVTSAGTLDMQGAGAVTIDSSGSTIGIGTDANTGAINVGTSATARTITIGNAASTEAQVDAILVDINGGTGGVTIDAAATGDIALTVPASATSDVLFSAHGQQHAFNTVAAPTLTTTAQAIVPAINEAAAAAAAAESNNWADALGNGTSSGANNPTIATGQSIVGADELTLVSTTTGDVVLDSGTTGTINIGVDGTNAKTLNLDSGTTGGLNVGTSAFAKTVTIGNVTGATSVVINAGTGNIDVGTTAQARTTNIATGAAAQSVTIGSLTGASTLLLQSGATGSITFDANTMTTPLPFNGVTSGDSGNQDLSSNFTASTLVGALNELKEGGADAGAVTGSYVTTGRAVGEAVIIDGNASAATQADATVLATSEGFAGLVKTVGAAGTGEIFTHGLAVGLFEAGITAPAAGDPIYISETSGRLTNVAPSGNPNSGIIVFQIGVMSDATSGSGGTGLTGTVGANETAAILLQPVQLFEL